MGLHNKVADSEASTIENDADILFPRQQGGDKGGKRMRSSICSTKRSDKSCSIPSKYSTTLFEKSKISGFGSTASRFNNSDFFDNPVPGPGNYEAITNVSLTQSNPSFSKKGYGGGFVSETDRNVGYDVSFQNKGPGPGAYEDVSDKNYKTSECFYYKSKSKQYRISNANNTVSNWNSYHKDLMRTTVSDKTMFKRKVGPGSYNPKIQENEKNPGNMLKSKAYDDYLDLKKNVPPVGRYMISRNITKKKPYKNPGPYSSFAGTVLQHKINLKDPNDMRKQLDMNLIGKKMITPDDLNKASPGPGDYNYCEAFEHLKDYRYLFSILII